MFKLYGLFEEGKVYDEEDAKEFETLVNSKDIVAVEFSSLGAMGWGGIMALVTKEGEIIKANVYAETVEGNVHHARFNKLYFIVDDIVHFNDVCLDIYKGDFEPFLIPNKWIGFNLSMGWFAFVRKPIHSAIFDVKQMIDVEDWEYLPHISESFVFDVQKLLEDLNKFGPMPIEECPQNKMYCSFLYNHLLDEI